MVEGRRKINFSLTKRHKLKLTFLSIFYYICQLSASCHAYNFVNNIMMRGAKNTGNLSSLKRQKYRKNSTLSRYVKRKNSA